MPAVHGPGLTPLRPVRPVAVQDADGTVLLAPLREALSGAGPALAPHPHGRPPPAGAVAPLRADEDDPADPVAAVVSTTGSTGTAKHVLLPASALLASAAATHDHLGGAGRWLLALPAHTVAGVQVVVRSLVAGTRPTVLDLQGGFGAAAFVTAATAMPGHGRRYTALVPTQLRRLLQDDAGPGARAALAGFDAVLVGGAALDDGLRERAQVAGVNVVSTYGMTETCGGCVYDGVPLPGVGVRVEPAPGAPAGAPGRVVLSGPVVARGYRTGRAPGTPEAARPTGPDGFVVRADGRRELRTADLGVLVGGRLVLHGRSDDVVPCGGVNVSLEAVATAVRTLPGVQDALAVGVPDDEWGHVVGLLLQPDPARPGPTEAEVRAEVRARVGRAAVPRHVRVVAALPLTGVGKPDRREAVQVVLRDPGDAPGPRLRDDRPPAPAPTPTPTPTPTEEPTA